MEIHEGRADHRTVQVHHPVPMGVGVGIGEAVAVDGEAVECGTADVIRQAGVGVERAHGGVCPEKVQQIGRACKAWPQSVRV